MLPCALVALALAAGFSDDFEDPATSPSWSAFESPGTDISEETGQLSFRSAVNSPVFAGYISTEAWDLRSGSVTIELIAAGDQTEVGWQMVAGLGLDADNSVDWIIEGGTAMAYQTISGTARILQTVPLSAETRWLRIQHSESADQISWQHGPDGVSWTTLETQPTPFALNAVFAELKAGTYLPLSQSRTGTFDNFSLVDRLDVTPDAGAQDAGAQDAGDVDGGRSDAGLGVDLNDGGQARHRFTVSTGCAASGADLSPTFWVVPFVAALVGLTRRHLR